MDGKLNKLLMIGSIFRQIHIMQQGKDIVLEIQGNLFRLRFWTCKFNRAVDYIRYDIPYGFKNLIKWFPVIWTDREWDYWFIYKMLHHKLDLMEKSIRKYGMHVHNERDADSIRKCVLILKRLKEDDYHNMAFKPYYKKWGEAEMLFTDIEDEPGLSSLQLKYPNVITEQDEILQNKEFKRYSDSEQTLKEQDLDMLFGLMRKHIQSWWD
jgi:hypothetical protein